MILTEQQMFDYIFCPCKYHIKYHQKIDLQDPVSLPKLLSKISKYFYMNLLNGKVPSINELKSKWDTICTQNIGFIDAKKNLAGWGLIMSLLSWASDEKIIVGDVDQNYKLTFGTIELVGTIETILVKRDKKIELLYTNFNDRDPEKYDLDTKLKYTLDAAAFLAMHGRGVDGIRIHCTKTQRDYFSYRTEPDYARLETTVRNVAAGIENNIFYPRESGMCSACNAKQLCKYWNMK